MKKLTIASWILVFSLIFSVGAVYASDDGPHWGYEGEEGPEHWGELSHDFAACSEGMEQSPIDIPATAVVNPADIVFNYQPSDLNIVNNGHTIKVEYDPGSSITVEGKTYNLLQFHFHALSEHTLQGNYQDMEMHLVHQSADGEYAVVGVLMVRGAEHQGFEPVWDHMPTEEGELETISGVTVNAVDLLPSDRSYYRYNGSFTTPPCTEGVKWFVMTSPVGLSDAQITAFERIYDHNYRPVQPFNDRSFLSSSVGPTLLPVSGAESTTSAPMGLGLVLVGMALVGIGVVGYAIYRRKLV